MSHLKTHDTGISKYVGSYSDAVEARGHLRWLFTSGTPGLKADGSLPSDIEGQTRQAWANVFKALEAADMTPSDMVNVKTTLINRDDIPGYVKVRKELLGDIKPSFMLTVATQLVKPEFLVEIEIIAVAP